MTHSESNPRSAEDDGFLADVFDRAVELLHAGFPVDADELSAARPDLRDAVVDAVRLAHTVSLAAAPVAAVLGGFEIREFIGHGAMGTVYAARQTGLGGRVVDLKVLAPGIALDPGGRERFRNEARTLARLDHPGVVRVLDLVHEGPTWAIAMERIDGRSLSQVIGELYRSGREPGLTELSTALGGPSFSPTASSVDGYFVGVAAALARALAAVHREGIVHRDVKPSNVLLRRDGSPVLSDFGLARDARSDSATRTGEFLGTPAYAAPEVLRKGSAAADARSDIYGLGATLYHCVTGELPFGAGREAGSAGTTQAAGFPVFRRRPPTPDLSAVILKAMDPEPSRRYPSMEAFAVDLERCLAGDRSLRGRHPVCGGS